MSAEQIIDEIDYSCTRCGLSKSRSQVVAGNGAAQARVVFVGEAPGRNEDEGGKPFIGASGKVLDEFLERAGLSRDEIFITNVCKCRPPKNRNPKADEIAACLPFLRGQLAKICPELVVTLGAVAADALVTTGGPMADRHAKFFESDFLGEGTQVLTLYHPAATIYNRLLRDAFLGASDLIRATVGNDHENL